MSASSTPTENFYTPQFLLLCLSSFLFFTGFNMIIPSLPDHLSSLGGQDYKGLIISLFTFTAGVSRPFSGKLADTIGRLPVIFIGVAASTICAFLYPFFSAVWAFLLLRLVHGISTGFAPTGVTSFVADIIPPHRRGEAMGFHGLTSNIGAALANVFGDVINQHFGIDWLFYSASLVTFLSLLIFLGVKETLRQRQPFHWRILVIQENDLIEPLVLNPFVVMVLMIWGFGTMLTITPDFCKYIGLQQRGWFFFTTTVASVVTRFLGGRWSDVYGRIFVLRIATLFSAVALLVIGTSANVTQLLLGAGLFGMGIGLGQPTLFAWATDLANHKFMGRAMATLFIGLELGIGLGAFIGGFLYDNQSTMFFWAYATGSATAFIAFIYLLLLQRPQKNNPDARHQG